MADATLGLSYPAGVELRDTNGSLIVASVIGTYVLTGPAGTSLATGNIAHLGRGKWGYHVPGSLLTTAGTYLLAVTISSGVSPTPGVLGETFTVGARLPDLLPLRDILASVYRWLGDGKTGTSTSNGSTTTLIDGNLVFGSDNDWRAGQIVILEPPALGDELPRRISGFTVATGTLTVPTAGAWSGTINSGTDYLLCNYRNMGAEYDEVLDAIRLTIGNARVEARVTDDVSLTVTSEGWYSLPAHWTALDHVYWTDSSSTTQQLWQGVARSQIDYRADRRQFRFNGWQPPDGYPLRIEGRRRAGMPSTLYGLVEVPSSALIEYAAASLAIRGNNDMIVRKGHLAMPIAQRNLERLRGMVL